ncbi:MAG: hypothetical protein CMI54_00610 [Parcubacteria group bacterium]|nr:hypothetical protein [Parcubacteria group bacterium]|tara:strand:- start:707 stop:1105 length:399 start_codon:yes stop_codon:yes gene_type:complete
MAKVKKDAYWHNIARVYLSQGMKPAQVMKCIKEVFPLTAINGRHIGAYKRRLVDEGVVDPKQKLTANINEAMSIADDIVNDEDRFVYDCSIGSAKRSLKCFEYKLTEEIVEHTEEIDIWVNGLSIKKTTLTT